ncbi:MAG TPA: GNAT family N-acetyltransferase [Candidatus Polarisedimenticolia bacterium]|nr:GNAT family N-acetyltransferase [Candidatus Polarisedimenticolia bacterium]
MRTPLAPASYRTARGDVLVRPVGDGEIDALLELIRELARYEQALERMTATPEALRSALEATPPSAEAVLAFLEGEIVGYAIIHGSFSSYLGRECLYLEDLYVRPATRGAGIGKALLAYVAEVTRARNLARLEWSSLAWNEAAKEFYEALGAKSEARLMYTLSGEALEKLTDRHRK